MLHSSAFLPKKTMTNPMRKYEGLFIFPPQDSPEVCKGEEKRMEELVRRFGGRTIEHKDWGRRPLGYPLKKAREGRFVVWNFEMETSRVAEFKKALVLDEALLQSTIVKPVRLKPVKEKTPTPKRNAPSPDTVREFREPSRVAREVKEEIRGRQS
jgi:ribosomal protein S6